MSPWALDSYLAGNCRAVDPGSMSVAGVLLASGHLQREGEIVLSDGKNDYTVGRPVIRKVLKTRIWGVPPACLGSR